MNDMDVAVEHVMLMLEQERLERKRAAARKYEAKKRAQNPDACRERVREYMKNNKASLNYYHRNKETVLQKQHEYYLRKKAKREAEQEEARLREFNNL